LTEAYASRPLTIVGVNVFEAFDDGDATRMSRFLADTRASFHLMEGTKSTIAAFGGIDRIPTVFVFDRAGGADFSWMNEQQVYPKGAVHRSAVNEQPPRLRGDALVVKKLEASSGIIFWDGSAYRWYEQGN